MEQEFFAVRGNCFTFLWIFIDYNLIHETLKFLCAILTANNQFRFSFDEKSLYQFYSVDIVCKKIKQCNENLTAGINLEWYVYFYSYTHLGNNTSSGFFLIPVITDNIIAYCFIYINKHHAHERQTINC